MKIFVIILGMLAAGISLASQASGKECALNKLPIRSTNPSLNKIYAGKVGSIEVRFHNENAPKPADIFPDPRVVVRNLTTAKSCYIKDGSGIWSGTAVYLDANERVLVLNEFSGSSDLLVLYDPKTCRRLAELDVSSRQWAVSADRIRTGQDCHGDGVSSCRYIQEWMLDTHCMFKGE